MQNSNEILQDLKQQVQSRITKLEERIAIHSMGGVSNALIIKWMIELQELKLILKNLDDAQETT